MYDNPVSWGILLLIAIALGIWFGWKCYDETYPPKWDNLHDPWDDPRNKW